MQVPNWNASNEKGVKYKRWKCIWIFVRRKEANLQFFAERGRVHYANCCILHVLRNVKIWRELWRNPARQALLAQKHATSQQSYPNDSSLALPATQSNIHQKQHQKEKGNRGRFDKSYPRFMHNVNKQAESWFRYITDVHASTSTPISFGTL